MSFPRLNLPSLTGQIPRDAELAVRQLATAVEVLAGQIDQIPAAPAPLTLAQINQGLQATGSAPLDITGLPGASTSVTVGTHATRLQTTPGAVNSLFVESDRSAVYVATATAWQFLGTLGLPIVLQANLWGDLGTADAGFEMFGADTGYLYWWSGNVWHIRSGVIRDTYANRPTVSAGIWHYSTFTLEYGAVFFTATDWGGATWALDYTSNALKFVWGGPYRVTLGGKPTLTTTDAGLPIYATDYNRTYQWTGSAWSEINPTPRAVYLMQFAPVEAGWHVCDGSVVAVSDPTGGTSNVTLPNYGSGAFPLGETAGTAAGTFGATGTAYTYQQQLAYFRL